MVVTSIASSPFPNVFALQAQGQQFLDSFDLALDQGTILFGTPGFNPDGTYRLSPPDRLSPETLPELLYTVAAADSSLDAMPGGKYIPHISCQGQKLGSWILTRNPSSVERLPISDRVAELLASKGLLPELNELTFHAGSADTSKGGSAAISWYANLSGGIWHQDLGGLLGVEKTVLPLARIAVEKQSKGLKVRQELTVGPQGHLGTTQLVLEFDSNALAGLLTFLKLDEKETFSEIFGELAAWMLRSEYYSDEEIGEWLIKDSRDSFYDSRNLPVSAGSVQIPERFKNSDELIVKSGEVFKIYRPWDPDDFLGVPSDFNTHLAEISGSRRQNTASFKVDFRAFDPRDGHALRPLSEPILAGIRHIWG